MIIITIMRMVEAIITTTITPMAMITITITTTARPAICWIAAPIPRASRLPG